MSLMVYSIWPLFHALRSVPRKIPTAALTTLIVGRIIVSSNVGRSPPLRGSCRRANDSTPRASRDFSPHWSSTFCLSTPTGHSAQSSLYSRNPPSRWWTARVWIPIPHGIRIYPSLVSSLGARYSGAVLTYVFLFQGRSGTRYPRCPRWDGSPHHPRDARTVFWQKGLRRVLRSSSRRLRALVNSSII
jgi:hypothetical protein